MFKIYQIWTFFRNMDGMGRIAWLGLFVLVPASGVLQAVLSYTNGGHIYTLIIIITMTASMMAFFIGFAGPGIKNQFRRNWPYYIIRYNWCWNPRDWFLIHKLQMADLNIDEQNYNVQHKIASWLKESKHKGRYRFIMPSSNATKEPHVKFSRRSDAIRFKMIWHKPAGNLI